MSKIDFTKAKVEIRAKLDELNNQAKNSFASMAKQLFDAYPQLDQFKWNQYTPHWNDGDTCEFSANTDDLDINNCHYYDTLKDEVEHYCGTCKKEYPMNVKFCPEDGAAVQTKTIKKTIEDWESLRKDVRAFLGCFEDADFQTLFGDHVEVKVTRQGISVEGYDHE